MPSPQEEAYPLESMQARPEVATTSLDKLRFRNQTVKCPACHYIGESAIPERANGTGEALFKSVAVVACTCCICLPAFLCIFSSFYESEPRYAAHFCEQCGLLLAYWYGNNDENIICAQDSVLTTITATIKNCGSDETPRRGAWSPLGRPPPPGSKLYANIQPIDPDPSTLRRVLHFTKVEKGFFTAIRDSKSEGPFLSVPVPPVEFAAYSTNAIFLPHPITIKRDSRHTRATEGGITSRTGTRDVVVYRSHNYQDSDGNSILSSALTARPSDTAAVLTFYRGFWRVGFQHHHPQGQHTTDQAMSPNPLFSTEDLFFPFVTDLGPLVWRWAGTIKDRMKKESQERVRDKKQKWARDTGPAVLVDAYNRVVATAELNASPNRVPKTDTKTEDNAKKGANAGVSQASEEDVILTLHGATELSEAFVEQVAISYLVVSIQTMREKDLLEAKHYEKLERARSD